MLSLATPLAAEIFGFMPCLWVSLLECTRHVYCETLLNCHVAVNWVNWLKGDYGVEESSYEGWRCPPCSYEKLYILEEQGDSKVDSYNTQYTYNTHAKMSHDRSHTVTIITFQCATLFLAVSPDPSALSVARGVVRVNNAMLQCKLLDYFWLVLWIRKEHIINVILLPTIVLSRL